MDTGFATIIGSIILAAGAVAAALLQRPPPHTAGTPKQPTQTKRERAGAFLLRWGWVLPWAYATWIAFRLDLEFEAAVVHFRELEVAGASSAQVSAATVQHTMILVPLAFEELTALLGVGIWVWILYKRSVAAEPEPRSTTVP